jgi:peptidoglycan/xylan/chitin deacetylase (PgdA/CDA1 family)
MRALVLLAVAACGDNIDTGHLPPFFAWDGQQRVGAIELDNLTSDTEGPTLGMVPAPKHPTSVIMVYGHVPGQTLSLDVLESILGAAVANDLPFYTFADLAAGGDARPGLCLSFDDNSVAEWYAQRELFQRYNARVTFFITRYAKMTPEEKVMLHTLYGDGHSMEAHTVDHLHVLDYVAQHGLDAYLADEVIPSIDILRADGFTPVAFAYPFGERDNELDAAILEHISIVRGISGTPLPGHGYD